MFLNPRKQQAARRAAKRRQLERAVADAARAYGREPTIAGLREGFAARQAASAAWEHAERERARLERERRHGALFAVQTPRGTELRIYRRVDLAPASARRVETRAALDALLAARPIGGRVVGRTGVSSGRLARVDFLRLAAPLVTEAA